MLELGCSINKTRRRGNLRRKSVPEYLKGTALNCKLIEFFIFKSA
jgi:hypothetical protein